MSKKSEKEKTKAAVLEKAAQNLPTAPAPGQLPAPDAQGVWNPPPLRPMAKVEEPVRVGPKVDWNGEPREPGDVPTRVLTTKAGVRVDPLPEVTDAVTPAPVEMPWEVFKQDLETPTKTETKPLTKASRKPRAPKPEKPVRKKASGAYQVLVVQQVRSSDPAGGLIKVLVPELGVYQSRADGQNLALKIANSRPGATVVVHRLLDRFVLQEVTKTTLVRS